MITVNHLHVRAGSFALEDVSFRIAGGCYAVLMGRTGSGKTTLLETVCGLRRPVSGHIVLDNRDVTRCRPAERGIGYVPQDAALFSTMTVRQHLSFALKLRRWSTRSISDRVGELSELLGLSHLLERRPAGLSGGERQRVALGRAIASYPDILCLDEPLSALDDETREEMVEVLKAVHAHHEVTTLHVTHNRMDAMRLADLVLRLEENAVRELSREELGRPDAFGAEGPAGTASLPPH